jgi:mRNA interferase MazF
VKIETNKITGVVLSDQIKSFDWRAREIEFITKDAPEKLEEIINKLSVLIFQ